MAETVTVFSCGTAASREDNFSIPFTKKQTRGRCWINDGPGSGHAPSRAETVLKKVEQGKGFSDWLAGARHWDDGLQGLLRGLGTQDNIVMSLQWLWVEFYERPFRRINLAGWSRGGVTSIMLAHAIQEAGFGNHGVEVNVFAFDPVPGGANDFGNKGTFDTTGRVGDPRHLPAIVNEYESILMENVAGWGGIKPYLFKSVQPTTTGNLTRVRNHPLPGTHADCVTYDDVHNPVGKIGIHLLHRFLSRHGTQLDWHCMQSDMRVLEMYAETRIKFSIKKGGLFHKKGAKKSAHRVRAAIVDNAFRHDRFFINQHHYDLMQQVLPNVHAFLTQGQPLSAKAMLGLPVGFPKTLEAMELCGAMG